VFCGTFDAKGSEIQTGDGSLRITRHGEICKFVDQVKQITFSGIESVRRGQQAIYVTERAVFRLTPDGMVFSEVAPGVDPQRDVLDRMDFAPLVPTDPTVMSAEFFTA
jgi:acyl CoA:acetate/3-ketoacid CoA transferase